MSRIIKTWRNPYDEGFTPTRPKQIEIQPGLTVLVGCNGAGKTTLLQNIQSELKKEKIPCHLYNNLSDGGSNSVGNAFFNDDYSLGATLMCSSEGETISHNIGMLVSKMRNFIVNGEVVDKTSRMQKAFQKLLEDDNEEQTKLSNERWLLLDAIDSGLSVDNVVEVLDVFNLMIEDAKNFGVDLYIVVSANEYELCRRNQCFNVNSGKYITFKDYEDYRKFIMKSRERKDKRYEETNS